LLDHFKQKISTMPAKTQHHPLVMEVQKGVEEIRPLVGIEDGTQISEKSVKEVNNITARLVKKISAKN
jgi:hypothetical protein